jgi:hypothetical protein
MPKRPADDANVETAIQAAGIEDDDWMQKLLEVDKEQLILIVSLIVNKSNIDNKSIKRPSLQRNGSILLRELVSLNILAISSSNTLTLLFINFHLRSIRLSSKIHGAHKTFIKRRWNRQERNPELESWTQ